MRVVSLLPSATEIVFALGRGDDLVGVTFECDFPPEARQRRIVTTSALPQGLSPAEIDAAVTEGIAAGEDLYRLDGDALADLRPDVVLTQDLCAVCAVDVSEVDDALAFLGCTAEVVTLDPHTIDEVLASVLTLGNVLGADAVPAAQRVVDGLHARLAGLRARVAAAAPPPVLLLEWTDPPFSAGHWLPDLVRAGGGDPVLAHPAADSRRMEWDDVRTCGASTVIVAPCGYHLEGARQLAEDAKANARLPASADVWAVDADAFFVRPGPRVVDGAELVGQILHPDLCGPPDAARAARA